MPAILANREVPVSLGIGFVANWRQAKPKSMTSTNRYSQMEKLKVNHSEEQIDEFSSWQINATSSHAQV